MWKALSSSFFFSAFEGLSLAFGGVLGEADFRGDLGFGVVGAWEVCSFAVCFDRAWLLSPFLRLPLPPWEYLSDLRA